MTCMLIRHVDGRLCCSGGELAQTAIWSFEMERVVKQGALGVSKCVMRTRMVWQLRQKHLESLEESKSNARKLVPRGAGKVRKFGLGLIFNHTQRYPDLI